ncbi:hypothetical protein HRG_000809 [Hirsutella rhossiliensis]|uniref:Uncharacterized protein n=1 Tax=Hirsutella rhossiliensis TaxID=111463 RepID=A0A9P8N7V9_9HYPO|nr:uncharacterized protein HRG_00809 [Hirsutella rhossiliensis]KAH0968167.1 hypothetical protein HRG_00809 [Hirsutella rhossiliensis]
MSLDYEKLARQCEADLNTYQSKTGEVQYGDELSTNRGYNKRIPPGEGGVLDYRGRQTRGEHFEGKGGPMDKANRGQPGQNDNDVVLARVPPVEGRGSAGDIATQGKQASRNNVGRNPPFRGENCHAPESVPDSISAEGWLAPESVTEASKESEGYR